KSSQLQGRSQEILFIQQSPQHRFIAQIIGITYILFSFFNLKLTTLSFAGDSAGGDVRRHCAVNSRGG
ncbi:hypothetical protein, partial [Klebsiella pneumoniae]|uniref:hypothetical protein n=1 Tax=Klebsiella pneumoniae TaxID=573 RepID=UPI001CA378F2